jgi:hypothetical protein
MYSTTMAFRSYVRLIKLLLIYGLLIFIYGLFIFIYGLAAQNNPQ